MANQRMRYPKTFQNLITHFASLPSVGPKAAERIVMHLFKSDEERITAFAESLEALHSLKPCRRCFNISENGLCEVCADPARDGATLCIVEEPMDVIAIERSGSYAGVYHCLGGVIEPGRENEGQLRIRELLERVRQESVSEVILALNPTTEGDMTALYLRRKLSEMPSLRISRLARGLSTGGDIEYADEMTLRSALSNREQLM